MRSTPSRENSAKKFKIFSGKHWRELKLRFRFEHALLSSILVHGFIFTLQFKAPELEVLKSLLGSADHKGDALPLSAVLNPAPTEVESSNSGQQTSPTTHPATKPEPAPETRLTTENGATAFGERALNVSFIASPPVAEAPIPVSPTIEVQQPRRSRSKTQPILNKPVPEQANTSKINTASASPMETPALIAVTSPVLKPEFLIAPMLPSSSPAAPVVADLNKAETQRQEIQRLEVARELAKRLEALEQEAARQEALHQEAQQLENALKIAAIQERQRQEAQLRELALEAAQKQEYARQEASRLEIQRQQVALQEVAKQESIRQEQARQDANRQELARQETTRQDAIKRESARQETMRRETMRQQTALQDAAKQEVLRQELEKQEALRLETARRDAAREVALSQEVARQESLRKEVLRQELAKQENSRLDTLKQEALSQEAAKQESARRELAKQDAARQEKNRREASINEALRQESARLEAGRREALKQEGLRESARLAAGIREAGFAKAAASGNSNTATSSNINQNSTPREGVTTALLETITTTRPAAKKTIALPDNSRLLTLLGRKERDARIQMFQEGWRQKIEQNAPFDLLQAAIKGAYENPLVTVALRQDGSVERVSINRSSGLPALDNAVRKIVQMLAPFDPIPRDLAMDYDAIEIVRVWSIGDGLRLVYGGR